MKKRWTEWRFKIRNRASAENSLKARTQWKNWKRDQRRAKQGISPAGASARHNRSPVVFKAPELFSLLDGPHESVRFFRELQDFHRHRDVFVDLSGVRRITPDAIAVLLSIVRHLGESGRLSVRGNYPSEPTAMTAIRKSGFDEYLKSSLPHLGRARGAILKRDTLRNSDNADGALARQLIDFAVGDGENKARLKPTYGHLLECMGNTHEHADPHPGAQKWWASVFRDGERACDCFTFVDMGVGIFRSLELARRLKLLNLLFNTHPDVLAQLLEGKIPSSTKKSYRGRGLPSIYKSCRNGQIRRFTMITNDVHADVESNRYRALAQEFKGVVLYWEVPHERS